MLGWFRRTLRHAARPSPIHRGAPGVTGFTLIELVCVVVVLAIIAALTVPVWGRSIRRFRAERYAAAVTELLRYAQAHAITRHSTVRVTLDAPSGRVELAVERQGGEDPAPLRSRWGRPLIPPPDVKVSAAPETSTQFRPDGSSIGWELRVVSPGSPPSQITVDPLTGAVSWSAVP